MAAVVFKHHSRPDFSRIGDGQNLMRSLNEKTPEKFDQSTLEGFAVAQATELLQLVPGLDPTTAGQIVWNTINVQHEAGKLKGQWGDRPLWDTVATAMQVVRERELEEHRDLLARVYGRALHDLTEAGVRFDLLLSWHYKTSR